MEGSPISSETWRGGRIASRSNQFCGLAGRIRVDCEGIFHLHKPDKMQPQMNTDKNRSVFICVHLWFRSYFWLRLRCAVKFVTIKNRHEFHD